MKPTDERNIKAWNIVQKDIRETMEGILWQRSERQVYAEIINAPVLVLFPVDRWLP
jgi:hypothetical protein